MVNIETFLYAIHVLWLWLNYGDDENARAETGRFGENCVGDFAASHLHLLLNKVSKSEANSSLATLPWADDGDNVAFGGLSLLVLRGCYSV